MAGHGSVGAASEDASRDSELEDAARRTGSHCLPASRGRPPRVHIASPRVADAWVTEHRAPYRGHLRAKHLPGPPRAEGTVRNRRNTGAIRVYTTASRDARCRPPRVLDREAVFVAKRIRNLLAKTFQAAYWGPRGVSIRLASNNRDTRPKGQREDEKDGEAHGVRGSGTEMLIRAVFV